MAITGILVVALSFLILGFMMSLTNPPREIADFGALILAPFLVLGFGSVFSIGIPYVVGAFVSIGFSNAPSKRAESHSPLR